MEKTMECERCWKIIKRLGNRKYCLDCRKAVDRELTEKRRRELGQKKRV